MSTVLTSPSPVTCHCQTVRRGRVESTEARTRWLRRPTPRPQGWDQAIVEVNGVVYLAAGHFHSDDDGRSWLIVDLHKANDRKHVRVILGQGDDHCDCEAATYRPQAVCKHRAAVAELLDQLDRLEQAERLLAEAQSYLERIEAVGPPPDFDPFTVELDGAA
jgi:hypothetical protein